MTPERTIAITGAQGVIGGVLTEGLRQREYVITPIDRPEFDVSDYDQLVQLLPNHAAVIHLAWNSQTENFSNGMTDPDNTCMFANVYKAALESQVKRVIMASSVHADGFYHATSQEMMKADALPIPDSPYGASKVHMEALGRFYSTQGLEVVCIRFGAVGRQNIPPQVADESNRVQVVERAAWLSHADCIDLVEHCLAAPSIPNNYEILYGVSNNSGRVHDITNNVGWFPRDNAENFH